MTARRKTLFFLLLILLLAYVLRIYKFNQTLKLDADVGMAYLIAERIIREKFLLLVGPTTSFGETVNIVPPTYYYLITFLYWLFRSDLVVTFIFMLMEVISVYIIFLLGKILDNTRTGLISALFYSTSSAMIGYSRHIWEPYRLPFFITLSFYLLFLSLKKNSGQLLLLSGFFYAVSLMYISSFLVFPFFLALFIYCSIKINAGKSKIRSIFQFLLILFLFYSPVIFFESRNGFPFINFLSGFFNQDSNFIRLESGHFLNSLATHGELFLNSVFKTDSLTYLIPYLILPFVFLILNLRRIKTLNRKISVILIMFSAGFLLTGFYGKAIYVHRLASLYPMFFIISAYPVTFLNRFLFRRSGLTGLLVFFIIMIPLSKYLISNSLAESNRMRNLSLYQKRYEGYFKVAEYILKSEGIINFNLFVMTPKDKIGYDTTSYYYALLKQSGINFADYNQAGNWIKVSPDYNKGWLYLICKDYNNSDYSRQNDRCFEEFNNITRIKRSGYTEKKYILNDIIYKIDAREK